VKIDGLQSSLQRLNATDRDRREEIAHALQERCRWRSILPAVMDGEIGVDKPHAVRNQVSQLSKANSEAKPVATDSPPLLSASGEQSRRRDGRRVDIVRARMLLFRIGGLRARSGKPGCQAGARAGLRAGLEQGFEHGREDYVLLLTGKANLR
jgi:hypothetical protein